MLAARCFILTTLLTQAPAETDPGAGLAAALEAAKRSLENDDPQRAYALLTALEREPAAATASAPASTRARLRALLGFAAEAVGDLETAVRALEEVARDSGAADPTLVHEACLGWARSALTMKDGELALKALARLPQGEPRTPQEAEMQAMALFFDGKVQPAEQGLLAVLKQVASPQASFYLGVIHFDRGDFATALERFRQCLAAEPENRYAAIYAARALLELGRLEEMDRALAPLLESGGAASAEPLYLRGKLRLRQERAAEAAASFRQALEVQPAYPEALFGLGAALRKDGKEADAREALGRFAAIHREEAKRLRRADSLSQAALRSSADPAALEEAARFFLETGDPASAESHAWRAVRLDPTRAAARLTLARSLASGGQFSAAAIQYRKLLEADPASQAARRELEALVERHGRRAQ